MINDYRGFLDLLALAILVHFDRFEYIFKLSGHQGGHRVHGVPNMEWIGYGLLYHTEENES